MRVHRLNVPIVFPSGASPGEGSSSNFQLVAQNGRGEPVLRGTAIAGVLRHAWPDSAQVESIFGGDSQNDDSGTKIKPSRLQTPDCVIQCGVEDRTHNRINRHTGAVMDKTLFSVEALPPNCTAELLFWLRDDLDSSDWGLDVMTNVAALFHNGLILGGRSARGIGLAKIAGDATYRAYDLTDLTDHAAYLDDHRAWRKQAMDAMSSGTRVAPKPGATGQLSIELTLRIPRGQDLLVSSGGGRRRAGSEPQTVRACDGREYWRLPGSSLRGVMQAWVSRLAAREGHPVVFSLDEHRKRGTSVTGEDVGWCFVDKSKRRPGERLDIGCPVASLFGSLAQRGRVHIADSFALRGEGDAQRRRHVAIDRITGGTNEGALFSNAVLVSDGGHSSPKFKVAVIVQSPSEEEARWLAQTIQALDAGVIRVGSSKAAGRLCLASAPEAEGRHSNFFTSIVPFGSKSERGTS